MKKFHLKHTLILIMSIMALSSSLIAKNDKPQYECIHFGEVALKYIGEKDGLIYYAKKSFFNEMETSISQLDYGGYTRPIHLYFFDKEGNYINDTRIRFNGPMKGKFPAGLSISDRGIFVFCYNPPLFGKNINVNCFELIGDKLKPKDDGKVLLSFPYQGKSARIKMVHSPDYTKCLLQINWCKIKGINTVNVSSDLIAFNENYEKIHHIKSLAKSNEDYHGNLINIKNSGDIFYLRNQCNGSTSTPLTEVEIKGSSSLYITNTQVKYNLTVYSKEGPEEYEISIPEKGIKNLKWKITDEDKVIFYGLYTKDQTEFSQVQGAFVYDLFSNEDGITENNLIPFDEISFPNQFYKHSIASTIKADRLKALSSKCDIYSYKLSDLVYQPNGDYAFTISKSILTYSTSYVLGHHLLQFNSNHSIKSHSLLPQSYFCNRYLSGIGMHLVHDGTNYSILQFYTGGYDSNRTKPLIVQYSLNQDNNFNHTILAERKGTFHSRPESLHLFANHKILYIKESGNTNLRFETADLK